MEELLDAIVTAFAKGRKALRDKKFTIAYVYIESARLMADFVAKKSGVPEAQKEAADLVTDAKVLLNRHREQLLSHEARTLLQICFYNYPFVWAQANQQIPHKRMVIFDNHGYWIPDPSRNGEYVFIGESNEEAMAALKELYEQLPAKYRGLPLNPMDE